MDKIANKDLFAAILASRILTPFLAEDPDLEEMLLSFDHPDIHYFDSPSPAGQIGLALKQRLAHMITRNIQHNLEATKQLVAFSEAHPESEIYNVTFNSLAKHYGVRCGRVDGQLHVICVMTGGRLSETLLGESIQ
jgi:hypothetical protein